MRASDSNVPLLEARDLVKHFPIPGGSPVQAVAGVSLSIREDEALGIVGETGSGKSTLVRSLLMMPRPTGGQVFVNGRDITALRGSELRRARSQMQMIFQDPSSSLDSRWTIIESVAEPLRDTKGIDRTSARRRAGELLNELGLDADQFGHRRPRELSGGQLQRVAIARAIGTEPRLLACDEPLSALDVSVQAQIINLFIRLREQRKLSFAFVSHDLSVVRHLCDRVAVLYLGRVCEIGPTADVLEAPSHPYTQALLDAVPGRNLTGEPIRLHGDLPSPANPPSGCRFRTRCPFAQELCAQKEPALTPGEGDHQVACHFPIKPIGVLNA